MNVRIEAPGPEISDSKIAELESGLGCVLPGSYRDFLLRFNGGRPWPDVVDVPDLSGSPTDVSVIFGIDRTEESTGLAWAAEVYAEFVAKGLIPFACDSFGNLYVFDLREEGRGGVLYADLQRVPAVLFGVASDFAEFIVKLREFD